MLGRDDAQFVLRFAREAFTAERLTAAGRVNSIGMVLVFVLIVIGGLLDLLQAVIRIWEPRYSTGAPSALVLLALFVGLILVCVLIVGLLSGTGGDELESP